MALDAMDALNGAVHDDEFVVASAFLRSLLEGDPGTGAQLDLGGSEIEEIAAYLGVGDTSAMRDMG